MARSRQMTMDEGWSQTISVNTRPCAVCGKRGGVAMSMEAWSRWTQGESLLEVAPDLTAAQREQLTSGIHPGCQEEDEDDAEVP